MIVKKNLNGHKSRNSKTSMMFTITVTFLLYCSTSFNNIEYLMVSLTGAIVGADIAVYRSNDLSGIPISLEEKKLSEYLDLNNIEQGGIVK